MVEFALVAPLFFFLIMALIDGSTALMATNGMEAAVANAARRGAISEQGTDIDRNILAEIDNRFNGLVGVEIERIVVYSAESFDAVPSQACQTGGGDQTCVVYGPADVGTAPDCDAAAYWCSAERDPGELAGVWVVSRYRSISGLTPISFRWTDAAQAIIEPEVVR